MAITQALNAKYPDWTQEDWDRFRWINSWNRRRRNLAPLLPCKRWGTAAIFEEDHEDMPYLMAKYPGPGIDADEFFGLEESADASGK
jgi:hypothetical protein